MGKETELCKDAVKPLHAKNKIMQRTLRILTEDKSEILYFSKMTLTR